MERPIVSVHAQSGVCEYTLDKVVENTLTESSSWFREATLSGRDVETVEADRNGMAGSIDSLATGSGEELAGRSDEQVSTFLRKRFASNVRPRAGIYWCDLLLSAGVGWTAFGLSLQHPFGSPVYLASTAAASLGLLRAALFIHEIAHVKRGDLPGFTGVWHMLVGLPVMLPSLMYVGSHGDHHRPQVYGTSGDPEYAPLAHSSRRGLVPFIAGVIVVPLLLPLRWGILGPMSYALPGLRCLVVQRASSLVINLAYRRPPPNKLQRRSWIVQEWAAALVVWLVCAAWLFGWLTTPWLVQWYVVTAGMLVVNQVRTLAAHRYAHTGEPLSLTDQLRDSVNLDGTGGWSPLTCLAAPVGLRYHALHHLLPNLPYHSLGRVHRWLRGTLPSTSSYAQTAEYGILSAIRALIGRMEGGRHESRLSEERAGEEA